jgi:hypothetical protein
LYLRCLRLHFFHRRTCLRGCHLSACDRRCRFRLRNCLFAFGGIDCTVLLNFFLSDLRKGCGTRRSGRCDTSLYRGCL